MQKNSSLSGSASWYITGNLFIRSLSFILLPFYSNYISTYHFGQYSLILSAYAIISVLYQLGMQNSLIKFYDEEPDNSKKKELFSSAFTFITIIGLVLTTLFISYSGVCAHLLLGSAKEAVYIRFASISLFFDTLNYFFLQLLKTNEESKKIIFYSAVSVAINLFLNFYLIYGLRMGIEGILTAQMLSNIVLFLMMFWDMKHGLTINVNFVIVKKVLGLSFPFLIAGFFTIGIGVIDRFFIDYFLGEEKVGIYSFAYRIAMIMNVICFSLGSVWIPYAIRRYNEGNYSEDFGKSFTKILTFSVLIFLVVSLLANDLFSIKVGNIFLFADKYYGGIIIIPVILLAYLFNIMISYFSFYLLVSGKSYHFILSEGMAFIVCIVCNYFLIPRMGIMGAAVSTLISFFLSFTYVVIISSLNIKIKYQPYKIASILFIAGIVYLVSVLLNNFFIDLMLITMSVLLFYRISGLSVKFLKEISY